MKNLLLLFAVVLIYSCSRSPVNSFIDEYNQENHTVSMTIPGWLVRTGTTRAFKEIGDTDDQRALKNIAQSLGKVRVMVASESIVPTAAIKELVTDARNDNYEDYVTVRDDAKIVNVMVKQEGDIVKNLLVLISSEEDFVITHIDSKLSISELENAQISWNKERNKNKKTAK